MKKKPLVSHPEKSANEWLADILQASGPPAQVDTVPEGWLSVPQMSEMTGTALSTINHKMIRLLRAGRVQRKKYRSNCGRHVTAVWYYYKAEEKA
jgi:hypothetical protein